MNDVMPTGPEAPKEQVLLDENIKAQEYEYYSVGAFKVSFQFGFLPSCEVKFMQLVVILVICSIVTLHFRSVQITS